jgi:SAM-dependent methyltransferase
VSTAPPSRWAIRRCALGSPIVYDNIGDTYARFRRPDARIAAIVSAVLGDAQRIVNVGAGAGSYEPAVRGLVAVEPARTMFAQRSAGVPVVQAVAEHVPFRRGAFDLAMALLTAHHWTGPAAGLAEMRRVAARQVVLTWDAAVVREFWLIRDYLPEIAAREEGLPTVDFIRAQLGPSETVVVPVPWDCTDGFLGAYWRRPERYLDAGARAAISALALLDPGIVARAMGRLSSDLDDGTWGRRHGHLRDLAELDLGYRLVVAAG